MAPLLPWMRWLLYFAGCYNLSVALNLVVLYHEMFAIVGFTKPPDTMFWVQLVGLLVGLFGVGYILVARDPIRNRNLLVLGWWSKALGSVLGLGHYFTRDYLPPIFIVVLFFSDIIYLVPFYFILRRIDRAAAGQTG